MSSRIRGKRALKRLLRRDDTVVTVLGKAAAAVPNRSSSFCSSSFHTEVRLANLDGHPVDAPQQKQTAEKEKDVSHPDAEPG